VTCAKPAIRFRAKAVLGSLLRLFPVIGMDVIGAAKAVVPTRCANCVGDSGRLTMSRNGLVSD
jgi:hypothetical protein